MEDIADSGLLEPVYNCAVEDFHTYFVGSDDWGFSIWAHNACDKHHPIPKVLGGFPKQVLLTVEHVIHVGFHKAFQLALDAKNIPIKTMGGRGWSKDRVQDILKSREDFQQRVFNILKSTAKKLDSVHGTEFLKFIKENLKLNNFKPLL